MQFNFIIFFIQVVGVSLREIVLSVNMTLFSAWKRKNKGKAKNRKAKYTFITLKEYMNYSKHNIN